MRSLVPRLAGSGRRAGGSLAVLAALVLTAAARAQNAPNPDGAAVRRVARSAIVTTRPVIDGRLDDSVWSRAEPLTGFRQREPRDGEPASERTEVRFLTDGEALYVAAWLYDASPAGIVPGEKLRDVTLTNSDYFAIILDTYHDRQNGFVFATTPAGVEYDGQVVKEGEGGGVFQQGQTRAQAGSMGGFNLNWDASWTVATSIDSLGWYAEFRIPFSTLRYGSGELQRWGLNAARSIRRKNEESFWAPIPRQFNLYRLSRAGTLEDIKVPARRVATVTPYALTSAQRDYVGAVETETTAEFGADAKIGLTPSLTLDLTYNTDFAQVEVDEQRTNLTRFPIFFPEKRGFFLENAGVFSAGTPQAVDFFFSRRIGIDAVTRRPVPIIGGGRLTGRVGGLSVGALQIFTDDAPGGQRANSYSVARVSRELPGRSRVGAMFVQRLAVDSGGDHNRTYAVDGRVGFGEAWTLDWWGAKTETPGRTGRDGAFSARIGWQTNRWNNSLRFAQVGGDFNPEVGFLSRSDYRFYEASIFRTVPIPGSSLLRYWLPHFNARLYYGFDGRMQSEQYHVDFGEVDFNNGGRFGPEINFLGEGLDAPFPIAVKGSGATADTVVIPAGTYRWVNNAWDFGSNPSAPVAISGRVELGGFYDGSRYGGNATLTVRQGASLTTSLLVDYNDVNLPYGDFVRSLVGLRVGYFFTPRIFIQSLMQYSNQDRIFSANLRFAWLNTAGTGLFVVFNDAEEATGVLEWTRPRARNFVVKFTKQFGTGG